LPARARRDRGRRDNSRQAPSQVARRRGEDAPGVSGSCNGRSSSPNPTSLQPRTPTDQPCQAGRSPSRQRFRGGSRLRAVLSWPDRLCLSKSPFLLSSLMLQQTTIRTSAMPDRVPWAFRRDERVIPLVIPPGSRTGRLRYTGTPAEDLLSHCDHWQRVLSAHFGSFPSMTLSRPNTGSNPVGDATFIM
jgi:hypothetical protein